jgi:cell division septation protein DedD
MDKALKQRLVGASVLIILAVIVLPMLLSGRSETLKQESRQIELPAKPDELSFETRRFPVGIPKPATRNDVSAQEPVQTAEVDLAPASSETPEPSLQQDVEMQEPPLSVAQSTDSSIQEASDTITGSPANVEVAPPPVASITLSSGRDENLDIPEPAEVSAGTPRYLVQVGSFSSEKNANALASQLRADNLPVLMDVVDRTAGRLHRVRVGPYAERAEADAVVSSLRSKIKDLSPRVLDLRPSESAPVSTPSDPLVRWVVQVGSFSNSKSAEALVAKLRLAGLTAFSEKVSSVNGTAYKVRLGPEIDRDKATELARKVKAQHNLDGFVTTQE